MLSERLNTSIPAIGTAGELALSAHTLDGGPAIGRKATAGAPKIMPKKAKKKQQRVRSKTEKAARRAMHLKSREAGYLEYMQYYNSSKVDALKKCNTHWISETRGEDERYRGIGCGERDLCPYCGEYVGLGLARDALNDIDLMLRKQREYGFVPDGSNRLGHKAVFTIHKELSERIESKLFDCDYKGWSEDNAALYEIARVVIRELVGPGWGGLQSMDYTGESAPVEAHNHTNAWIAPARMVGGEMIAIPHWFTDEQLEQARAHYTQLINEHFGTNYATCDITIHYLHNQRDLTAWIQYLYKHQLHDLWSGWQSYENDELTYKYTNDKGEYFTKVITRDELGKCFDRLAIIPNKHKRVRWAGYLSDGQRGKQFELLGLEKEERDDDGSKWIARPGVLTYVRFVPDGVVLQDENGEKVYVDYKRIGWAPSGVNVGRRVHWKEKSGDGPPADLRPAAPARSYGFSWEKDERTRDELLEVMKRYAS